jgi:hypothetical protein
MPVTPTVVLEIDDNTPANQKPFTNDVSMWSFADDLNVQTRTGAEVFRKLHASTGSSTFRGYPERAARATRETFDGLVEPTEVTWVTAAELPVDRGWLPAGDSQVERSLRMMFEAFELAARQFGADRVRLVFAFV